MGVAGDTRNTEITKFAIKNVLIMQENLKFSIPMTNFQPENELWENNNLFKKTFYLVSRY